MIQKLCLLLSITSLILLGACRTDDLVAENTETDDIVGTWNVSEVTYEVFIANIKVRSGTGEVTGTLTFNADGTGKEDYTITVDGTTEVRDKNFNWENDEATVIFDKGTEFEQVWTWQINEPTLQRAKYTTTQSVAVIDVVVTLTK